MSQRWYYQLLNEEFGPVPQDQILQLVEDGTLDEGELVRREDQQSWIPITQMDSAVAADSADAEPSELSDLSELSFSFEDSSAKPDISEPSVSEPDDQLAQMDDICFEDSSAPPADEQESQQEQWYVQSGTRVSGPYSLQDLIRQADAGAISETDQVRQGDGGPWMLSMEIPELTAAFFSAGDEPEDGEAVDDEFFAAETLVKPPLTGPDVQDRQPPGEQFRSASAPAAAPTPATAPAEAESAKPRRRKTQPAAGRKKRKKRVRKSEDVLEDVFSEVFSDDNQPAQQRSSNAAAAPVLAAATEEAPTAESAAQQESAGAEPTAAADAQRAPQAPSAMQAAVAGAAEAKLSKTKPKRSRGKPLQLPSPATLGIGAAVAAVLLIVAGFVTGAISLPSFGFTPDVKGELTKFGNEYRQLSAGPISDADWLAFGKRVRPTLKQINDYIIEKGDQSEADERHRQAAAKMLQLVNYSPGNTERQQATFEEFEQLMSGG